MSQPPSSSLSPYLGFALAIVGGIWAASAAWSETNQRIAMKADRSEVQQVEKELKDIANDLLAEMRVQRVILCRQSPRDSFCEPTRR